MAKKFWSKHLFKPSNHYQLKLYADGISKIWKSGKRFCVPLILGMMFIMLADTTGFTAGPHKHHPKKGRLLVHLKSGLTSPASDKAIRRHGGRLLNHIRGANVRVVEVAEDENVTDVLTNLAQDPQVKFVEEDRLIPVEEISADDPYYDQAWHLQKVQAPSAWETSTGNGVVVAVLDTGVNGNHPDLFGQTVPGWNVYDDNDDTSDVYGHGTKVAGTVAAASDNGIGVTSVAWDALIMPVRVSGPDGYAFLSDIAQGIVWAADHGAQVANISYDASSSLTIQSAASYMREHGGVVVVAAGNRGSYQSIAPSTALISVGATDKLDVLASFSSYGEYIDLTAPGVGIYTTNMNLGYSASSGTSFSSPVVAAVVALMMAVNPSLDPSQIDSILKETADDVGNAIYYGSGRVNALAAVLAAWESTDFDTEAPAVEINSPQAGNVAGVVAIDVTAVDNVGVSRVELYADGERVGEETSEPFAFSWDSTTVADGPVTLVAYAYDAAGNESISAPVTVTVQNEPDPPVCGDLDADGDVDRDDYMIFFGTYGLHAADPGYVRAADFDGDQWITLQDFRAWYRCYQDYLSGK